MSGPSCAARFVGGSQDGKLLVVAFPMRTQIVFAADSGCGREVYRRRRRVDAEGRVEDVYEVEA